MTIATQPQPRPTLLHRRLEDAGIPIIGVSATDGDETQLEIQYAPTATPDQIAHAESLKATLVQESKTETQLAAEIQAWLDMPATTADKLARIQMTLARLAARLALADERLIRNMQPTTDPPPGAGSHPPTITMTP